MIISHVWVAVTREGWL